MPGLTTPKGGATTTSTTQQAVPAYAQAAQQSLLNQASNILGPQLQQQQYTQAGINPDQSAAYDLTRNVAQSAFSGSGAAMSTASRPAPPPTAALIDFRNEEGTWKAPSNVAQAAFHQVGSVGYDPATYGAQGYAAKDAAAQGYDPTKSTAEQVTGGEIQKLLNPYTQSVVDTTLQQMGRTRDEAAAKNNARAAAAGSFGGSRQALQSAQLDRSFGEQSAQTTATLMSAGFDKATATALANAGMRQQTSQANQSAANAASQFGASAQNTASLNNAAAQNAAAQFGANANNAAGQFNASAQNAEGQFDASAFNNAYAANSAALNNTSQFNASAQNARDQYNSATGAGLLQNYNSNALSRYGADLNNYTAQNSTITSQAQLLEAIKSGDQTRQMQAIQALLGQGNAQQQMVQSNISLPLQYLSLMGQLTPSNYGQTNTTTAPNNAPSPLQTIIGGVGTALTSAIPGSSILGGLLK
ncbi:hypothetical protein [Methylobacterium flocculans]|uniref:hypothetical protein n=1 Tax=Methylobacterium flocculans TaxID=2984843 RepID=UPI0021F351B9|nr:hypothetical protein [Methylobacterium sp. FF17]